MFKQNLLASVFVHFYTRLQFSLVLIQAMTVLLSPQGQAMTSQTQVMIALLSLDKGQVMTLRFEVMTLLFVPVIVLCLPVMNQYNNS